MKGSKKNGFSLFNGTWGIVTPILIVLLVVIGSAVLNAWLPIPTKPSTLALSGLFVLLLTCLTAIIAAQIAKLRGTIDVDEKLNKCEKLLMEFSNESSRINSVLGESANTIVKQKTILSNLQISLNTFKQIMADHLGDSLVNHEDLAHLEANVKPNSEIWILTSSMQLEATELENIILDNLKKGVTYKYLIPLEDKFNLSRFKTLARQWQIGADLSTEDAIKQIQCFLVPCHMAYMTVIIYDPYNIPPDVLVKFPTSDIYTKQEYPLIYKVESTPHEAWKVFVDALQSLLEEERECTLTKQLDINFTRKSDEKNEQNHI